MIDRDVFKAQWNLILGRFGREWDAPQAAAYFGFLSDQMETEEFKAAAAALWATATFFPKPSEFLMIGAARDWPLVLKAIDTCHAPDWSWAEHFRALSPRGRAACIRLGGIPAMKEQLAARGDVTRLKTDFDKSFEQETAATAAALAISAPPALAALSVGTCAARLSPVR